MLDKVVMSFLVMFAVTPVPTGIGWQKDKTVVVSFVQNPNSPEHCGVAPEGMTILGCVNEIGGDHITLPNPCLFRNHDAYARLACHELGHTNWWRHEYR